MNECSVPAQLRWGHGAPQHARSPSGGRVKTAAAGHRTSRSRNKMAPGDIGLRATPPPAHAPGVGHAPAHGIIRRHLIEQRVEEGGREGAGAARELVQEARTHLRGRRGCEEREMGGESQ